MVLYGYEYISSSANDYSRSNRTTSATRSPTFWTSNVRPASLMIYAPSPSCNSRVLPAGPLSLIRAPFAFPGLYPDFWITWTYALRCGADDADGSVWESVVDGEMRDAKSVRGEWTGAGPGASRFSTTPCAPTGPTMRAH